MVGMTALIIGNDPLTRMSTRFALKRNGVFVREAGSAHEALRLLDAGWRPGVVICDADLRGCGIHCLRAIRDRLPYVSLVLAHDDATAQVAEASRELGEIALLRRPFGVGALLEALSRSRPGESDLVADVDGFSVVDILQMLHMNRRTVRVDLDGQGCIHLVDGEIVHAELEEHGQRLTGELACRRLIDNPMQHVRTAHETTAERSIDRRFEHLLLDALTGVPLPVQANADAVSASDHDLTDRKTRRPRGGLRRFLGLR